jgi:hypothetical protein
MSSKKHNWKVFLKEPREPPLVGTPCTKYDNACGQVFPRVDSDSIHLGPHSSELMNKSFEISEGLTHEYTCNASHEASSMKCI